ncbi:hypothetical protein [Terribacillus sp. 7520-G]|uniref:hypothetical protein n=1 Tax=Terribacillus sp. 7520-G TaxID=2025389 RepID=UPI000BA6001B|nr:hypothetical protein [Terribacillus sp. 7520-G]PAD39848.1 hypothetical protein CHH53_03965 [Terribacillus sp. 7520-G]
MNETKEMQYVVHYLNGDKENYKVNSDVAEHAKIMLAINELLENDSPGMLSMPVGDRNVALIRMSQVRKVGVLEVAQ